MRNRKENLGIVVTKIAQQGAGDPRILLLGFDVLGCSHLHLVDISAKDLLGTLIALSDEQLEDWVNKTEPLIFEDPAFAVEPIPTESADYQSGFLLGSSEFAFDEEHPLTDASPDFLHGWRHGVEQLRLAEGDITEEEIHLRLSFNQIVTFCDVKEKMRLAADGVLVPSLSEVAEEVR